MIRTMQTKGSLLKIRVGDKLTKEDFDLFLPQVEQLIEREGAIRILFDMDAFTGWSAGALWEETKFDLKHFKDIERIAFVGDRAWQEGMSFICKPFTKAEIRYFPRTEKNDAETWLETPAG